MFFGKYPFMITTYYIDAVKKLLIFLTQCSLDLTPTKISVCWGLYGTFGQARSTDSESFIYFDVWLNCYCFQVVIFFQILLSKNCFFEVLILKIRILHLLE